MFDDATVRAVERIAARMKVEAAMLLAVAEVESNGQVFAMVDGSKEPLIRWEGHYFDERLKEPKRSEARRLGLASPKVGGIKNPRSQQARWDKLLRPASKMAEVAAFESTSWGLGQVMGAHWRALGFASPGEMLATARAGAGGQIELMALYIDKFGLADELQRKDFTAFTRGYNGPAGIKAGYHVKMAAAYKRLTGARPVSSAAGMLRMGSTGARVRELQALLVRAGHALKVDGDFGPSTKAAVTAFQRSAGLTVDGVAGPETMRALAAYKAAPDEQPGSLGALQTQEAKQGGAAILGAAGLETASRQIDTAADRLAFVPGLEWLAGILTVVAVLLVLGGLSWAAYGWWKGRQTDEGDIAPAGA